MMSVATGIIQISPPQSTGRIYTVAGFEVVKLFFFFTSENVFFCASTFLAQTRMTYPLPKASWDTHVMDPRMHQGCVEPTEYAQ